MLSNDFSLKCSRMLRALVFATAAFAAAAHAQNADLVRRFAFSASGLVLDRPTQAGRFFDVAGRKAVILGFEHGGLEVWAYPMKLIQDFTLSFEIEDYPIAIEGSEIQSHIEVRPEATTVTYSHAAFTVRQIMLVPHEEAGAVILLDVDTVRPLRITASFRPALALMWPAGLMTGYVGWDRDHYFIGEESGRFAGVMGSPLARDISLQPYQEEPKDLPNRFVMEISPDVAASHLIPIVVAGSVEGREAATALYEHLMHDAAELYDSNVEYYRSLLDRTTKVRTPDERLSTALEWAKIGVDKGLATNPYLGTGFLAGYRTSGNSERPGFAWFFGRDALWTALSTTSYGDFETTRTALNFLKQFQREDGKIPHEISQSASLLPWFTDYGYAWASADATPLYIILHDDYLRASGDRTLVDENWESIKKAYAFSKATDADGDGLIENTGVGHGWVEGGALYPAHEELYMEGLWVAALEGMARMARLEGDRRLADDAERDARDVRTAIERTYWLGDAYAFATREDGSLVRENTVLPAVPLWFDVLDGERAQLEIDRLGSGELATDWGTRILSNASSLYDPLSYHYGSVWPLFTGWASEAAYRYGRPHVGLQALTASALLTYEDALGVVTELLSGDYNAAFGRSSHHQIWSEAMVVTPFIRGLLGLESVEGHLRFAPQLPADWDSVSVGRFRTAGGMHDIDYRWTDDGITIRVRSDSRVDLDAAPALPLDAVVHSVEVDGREVPFSIQREGDVQEVVFSASLQPDSEIKLRADRGTDVYVRRDIPLRGARNEGLRILQSRAEQDRLTLLLEGLGGRTYELFVRSPKRVGDAEDVEIVEAEHDTACSCGRTMLRVRFDGPGGKYVRRKIDLELRPR